MHEATHRSAICESNLGPETLQMSIDRELVEQTVGRPHN